MKTRLSTLKPLSQNGLARFTRAHLGLLTILGSLVLCGCDYDVPITAKPTRKIDNRLVGNWTASDGTDKMRVCRWDDSFYAVAYNDALARAYHSEVAGMPLISAQDLAAGSGKFSYVSWRLSEDGKQLWVRAVNDKVVPYRTPKSKRVQQLLKENRQNPDLFQPETLFNRDPN